MKEDESGPSKVIENISFNQFAYIVVMVDYFTLLLNELLAQPQRSFI